MGWVGGWETTFDLLPCQIFPIFIFYCFKCKFVLRTCLHLLTLFLHPLTLYLQSHSQNNNKNNPNKS